MWQSVVNGQTLKFHLAGINNQNFIMRDEETGSWWQQISGAAIQGAMKGQRLVPVDSDELSYGIWKRENPNGRVLRPEAGKQESADWEKQVGKMPVRIASKPDDALEPRPASRVELEVMPLPADLETPDLPVRPALDQRAGVREVLQRMFQLRL